MIPLFLVITLIPFVTHFQVMYTNAGYETEFMFFWKDKALWILSFLSLFFISKRSAPLFVFWFFLFWSTLFSIDLGLSIWGMPSYAEGSITFFCYGILFLAAPSLGWKWFDRAVYASVVTMMAMAVLQLLYGCSVLFPPIKWLSGLSGAEIGAITYPLYTTLANPNHLGLYCALLFPIVVRKKPRLSFLLFLLAVGSSSRGAWIAILLTMPSWFWRKWKWFPVGILTLLLFFWNTIVPKFSAGSPERFFMWKHGVKLLKLIGNGPATFAASFPQGIYTQAETNWAPGIVVDRPHDMYIQVAHATGILSLIPLVVILYFAVRRESVYRYGVFGFLIAGIFTDSMVGVTPIFAILVGLLYFEDRQRAVEPDGEDLARYRESRVDILVFAYLEKCRSVRVYIGRKAAKYGWLN